MAGVQSNGRIQLQFGTRLRALREQRGMTFRDLERVTGIGRSRLQQLEAVDNPNPTLSVLLALQGAYGLDSIEALFGALPSQIVYERYQRSSDSVDGDEDPPRPA